MRSTLVASAIAIALAACTTTADTEATVRGAEQFAGDPRLGDEVDRICFASSIDSFGETTRDTIVLREGQDRYLVEVFGLCSPLRSAQSVGVDSFGSCLSKGDYLVVSETLFPASSHGNSFETARCNVRAIYNWNPDATAEDSGETDSEETPEDAPDDA